MRIFVILVLIVAAIAALAALQYHFILIDDGIKVLKKTEPSFEYTFVDGRGLSNLARILVNPTLVKAGIRDIFSGEGITIRPKEGLKETFDDRKD